LYLIGVYPIEVNHIGKGAVEVSGSELGKVTLKSNGNEALSDESP
jgi:hypothetical protein